MSWKLTKKLKDAHLSSKHNHSAPSPSASSPTSSSSISNPSSKPGLISSTLGSRRGSTSTLNASKSSPSRKSSDHSSTTADGSTRPYASNGGTASAGSTISAGTEVLNIHSAKSTSTLKPGLLTVIIDQAEGLSLPSNRKQTEQETNGSSRRNHLPYIVVEFDKTQVIVDARAGTLKQPLWESTANFDVSRSATLSLQIYVRSGTAQKREEDIFIGSCSLVPKLEAGSSGTIDEWLPLNRGTGKIHIKLSYKANKNKALTIEDFDLLKVVGKGSFGKVMQVRKRDTHRIYALKTIRKAHIVSRSEVNHTLAERTVLAQIDNPFIVPLKFCFQSPEKLYFVLAFVNGGELFHHLQREGRFDLNRARFYTAELLCALECLHHYNVIYRDLKPENILLDYTGHIALCDFGLCKLNMAKDDKTNTFCGTPEYLAPELLLGQGYTKAVDWWTLGVLLYEMLTGLPPFYNENVNEMYRKILQDPLTFPNDMHPDAKSILIGLLNRDPKKRLGVHGASEIKQHKFFTEIDWKRLMRKGYVAPFKPSVESATDTSNFDKEFTSEVPTDSVVDDYLSESVQKQFGGWTYNDSRLAGSADNSEVGPGSVIG